MLSENYKNKISPQIYVTTVPTPAKEVHRTRADIDLLMTEKGIDAFHHYSKSLAKCGVEKAITAAYT